MAHIVNIPVIHASTVHPWWDNRVTNKMVMGLAKEGLSLYFILNTFPKEKRPNISNLKIITLNKQGGLKERIIKNWMMYKKAVKISPKGIFHFHDPELIFVGVVMRLHGWKVVYDVHEDVYLDIAQKDYLGKIARRVFPYLFRTIEQAVIYPFGFHVVNAERAYKVRYPQGVEILNYPKQAEKNINNDRDDYNKINLIYTGVLVIDRGAFLFKELLNIDPNIHITVIGKCSHELRQKILNDCKSYKRQLSLFTTPEGMPFDDITTLYERGNWTAGLAVFPDTAFYRDKELTKFFEYIQYSIPVLSSNFPTWSSLIEDQNIGLCIDPKDISGSFPKALTLFRDSKKWCILRDNCKSISKKYSWESQQKKLIYLYKKIC